MAERATITQYSQLGVEAVKGTPVAATKRLLATSILPQQEAEIKRFRPYGLKFPTIAAVGREWASAAIEGFGSYTDLVYLLASLVGYADPVQQDATPAYKWTFTPDSDGEDTVKSYTVEYGGSVRGQRFAYGLVNSLEMSFSRDGVEISGEMIGQALEDNHAMSAAVDLDAVPILGRQLDVYLDDSSAGLGTTRLNRYLKGSFSYGDRFGPLWAVNSTASSFTSHVEREPKAEIKLVLEADAQGMELLATMRAGATKWLRIKAVGDEIATPYSYTFQLDAAVKVSEPLKHSDEDGVCAVEWTLTPVHDGTWGKAFTIDVINNLNAL